MSYDNTNLFYDRHPENFLTKTNDKEENSVKFFSVGIFLYTDDENQEHSDDDDDDSIDMSHNQHTYTHTFSSLMPSSSLFVKKITQSFHLLFFLLYK